MFTKDEGHFDIITDLPVASIDYKGLRMDEMFRSRLTPIFWIIAIFFASRRTTAFCPTTPLLQSSGLLPSAADLAASVDTTNNNNNNNNNNSKNNNVGTEADEDDDNDLRTMDVAADRSTLTLLEHVNLNTRATNTPCPFTFSCSVAALIRARLPTSTARRLCGAIAGHPNSTCHTPRLRSAFPERLACGFDPTAGRRLRRALHRRIMPNQLQRRTPPPASRL